MAQAIELPETLEDAHALILEQASFIQELRGENAELKHRLDQHARRLFGKRSEQLDAAQLQLAFAALNAAESDETDAADEVEVDVPAHKRRRKGHGRTKFSDDIPRARRVLEPDDTDCPICTKPMTKIGEETSEQLNYRLQGKNPFAWLKDVLDRVRDHPADRMAELTPRLWTPESTGEG